MRVFNNAVVLLAILIAIVATGATQTELAPGSPELINPDALAKMLQSNKGQKPLILQVGPRLLFEQAHITGAEYIGATSEREGLERLQARVKSLPHAQEIVLYCGCCPWNHCPNIRPAFKELHALGFSNVKALYIANNFGTDWVDKGYPIAKGE